MKLASLHMIPLMFLMSIGAVHSQDKPVSTEVDGKIEWVFDLEEGQQLSKELDKPVFIVFRCER